ncbi:MAG: hypothetical protein L0Z54_04875 [Thermoplasmata archaeon]|nr:hypothetical protein [Thermoplasmata archaeon]
MARDEMRLEDAPTCPKCGRKNFCNDHGYMNRGWWEEYARTMVSWRRVGDVVRKVGK